MPHHSLIASPTNILTIHDVLYDSPVWRANILHLEYQIEQFEKWIDGFLRSLKNYIDVIKKYNTQASTLCKKTFLNKMDDCLIDSDIVGNVINKFASTLQSTIAYKMKMASDMEDLVYNPLQKMMKQDLKEYKEGKKQFDKTLDKYETQLYKYNLLSKQKEASALREDAFQMHEYRKQYIKSSGDYFIQLISLKSTLENMLIEYFSNALSVQIEEVDESTYAYNNIKKRLSGWKQWLMESKNTLEYQIPKIKTVYEHLEEEYIAQIKPQRSLKRYSMVDNNSSLSIEEESAHDKQGYLNSRISSKSSRSWVMKWFFLQNGWFGTCSVSTVNKEKGCIIVGDRVLMTECVYRVMNDSDRRFCFEVTHPQCTYLLQAENEDTMLEWLHAFKHTTQSASPTTTFPGVLLFPLTELTNLASSDDCLIYMSSAVNHENSLDPTATTSFSLTSLMIQEDHDTDTLLPSLPDTKPSLLSSWTVPWLTTSLTSFTVDDTTTDPKTLSEDQLIVWPTKIEMEVTRPSLDHYSSKLEMRHRQLRTVFSNVPPSEVVIESFFVSLLYHPTDDSVIGYSGMVYITQNFLWFYSCKYMTCVNIIVLPLKCVQSVQLQDADGPYRSELMLNTTFESYKHLSFGIGLEVPDVVYEKLKVIIANNKSDKHDLQILYDTVRIITPTKLNKNKIPTNHITTSRALYASVTPLTVQGQHQYTPVMEPSSSTATTLEEEDTPDIETILSSSPAQGALKAVFRKSLPTTTAATTTATTTRTPLQDTAKPLPAMETTCECQDHPGTKYEYTFPIEAQELFELLFGDDTVVWTQLNQLKGYGTPILSPWTVIDGHKERTMKYRMPVSNPMIKAKETDVVDIQNILSEKEFSAYTVSVTTNTPNLPYADAFTPCIRYCITHIEPMKSRLICTADVKWMKSVFVKSIINRAAMKGMEETVINLVSAINKQIPPRVADRQEEHHEQTAQEEVHSIQKETQYASYRPTTFYIAIGIGYVLFMLYQLRILNQYKTRLTQHTSNNTMIIWRGVYLRDIEKEITDNEVVLKNVNQRLYRQFQMTHINEASWEYNWANRDHRYIASELGYIRERLGALRYELLSAFRILNRVEYELLENQYWNWLSDKKIECMNDTSDICLEITEGQS